MRTSSVLTSCGILASLASFQFGAAPALADDVSVTVDGQYVTLAPQPLERAGRVFVPLRGIFERLGASVVYAGGIINATGDGSNISLRIGSTQAQIDGQTQTLDVAPFIVGASTYVPLRFISEALGAHVNYDGTNRVVAINTSGGAQSSGSAPAPAAMPGGKAVTNVRPGGDTAVSAERPTISGEFAQPVDPNSMRLTLDGLDVTAGANWSRSGFVYAPPSPLQSKRHRVEVAGTFRSGQTFSQRWTFTSGAAH
ncbi:MAG: copper amine oxidase N-terminal domain-containing protein [Candidatus Baltobacteraceae bacterium]